MTAAAQPLPRFSPRRPLGRTGFPATRLGIGDIADRSLPKAQLVRTLERALDAGLNVIDTAPGYEDGFSEEVVGDAVRGRRDAVFVIDKIDLLHEPVVAQVDESLARLGLDHVDLFAFHAVSDLAVWRTLVEPGGPFDQLAGCVRAGKARFRGVSSHHPLVLREALDSGLCDVVLFPVGPFCDPRYVEEILPLARQRGVGVVSFKTFGAGKLLGDTEGYGRPLAQRPRGKVGSGGGEVGTPQLPHLSVAECVRYTLSLDPDVALLGMSHPNEQDQALHAAAAFQPMEEPERAATRARAEVAMQGKGAVWWNPPA